MAKIAHLNYYKTYKKRFPHLGRFRAIKATYNYILGIQNAISKAKEKRPLNPNEIGKVKEYLYELVCEVEDISGEEEAVKTYINSL